MEADALKKSLEEYNLQIFQVRNALKATPQGEEHDSLAALQSDLQQLIDLTKESLETLTRKQIIPSNNSIVNNSVSVATSGNSSNEKNNPKTSAMEDEYALFMAEMAQSGAYEGKINGEGDKTKNGEQSHSAEAEKSVADVDIEEELTSLEGMKCSALHCHKWGGAPSLHNAMVCSVVRDDDDENTNFFNIMVRVMFTNPTHIEMVPCPYFLEGDCKFTDDQCRFSHGEVVALSSLSEAIEPNFSLLRPGCRTLAKLTQNDEPTSSKISEKFLLWHRAVVKTVDGDKKTCEVKLEHESGIKTDGKNYHTVDFRNILPLTDDGSESDSDSDSSVGDISYPYVEDINKPGTSGSSSSSQQQQLVQRSLMVAPGGAQLGDWEKHTKGIGSKLMMSMGYVAGTGLGPQGSGRVQPVPCRPTPQGRSLDHCMKIRQHMDSGDPIKAERKLLLLQKKQDEKERKAYERAKERERHDVFNVLNRVIGFEETNQESEESKEESGSYFPPHKKATKLSDIKSSTCKNLNIEHFKIAEELNKLEKEISKIRGSLGRNSQGTDVHKALLIKLDLKCKEMDQLKRRQSKVTNEQSVRKDKRKLSVF